MRIPHNAPLSSSRNSSYHPLLGFIALLTEKELADDYYYALVAVTLRHWVMSVNAGQFVNQRRLVTHPPHMRLLPCPNHPKHLISGNSGEAA